ncbi:myrosinase 1 [Cimex lectularius]|uniref:Beta-glucosidase n=1 Tax=Cimex lectularius TaxID=79782 RepID=A0A8I6RAS3_CIMLE|nr:myrosinase 1 [Cimex lectularius]
MSDFTDERRFPEGFIFGVASSSYQVEGAWCEDGKGESIWDRIVHTNPGYINDTTNADVACDMYHLYKTDVKLIKEIGFDFYRFSISWPRILPTGEGKPNPKGIRFYNGLIDELLTNGIQPMVTMYHWDLPQALEEKGGWLCPEIADHFEAYAKILFENFGDRVKWWITINEPSMVAMGYGDVLFAPASNLPGIGDYIAGHNALRAHAQAYHLYNKEFRAAQKGKVSISLCSMCYFPKTSSKEDKEAAERATEFELGWFANPIFSEEGDYPKTMKNYIQKHSETEGLSESRLPAFTDKEINLLKGSADYFAFQHYTSRYTTTGLEGESPSIKRDSEVVLSHDAQWEISKLGWFKNAPHGFRTILNWIKEKYNNPEIIITENGYGDMGETGLEDQKRIQYLTNYLNAMLEAINEDKCNITGYTVWSLMDNFEWTDGYQAQFGIYKVDFNDGSRPRSPKASAFYIKRIIEARKL